MSGLSTNWMSDIPASFCQVTLDTCNILAVIFTAVVQQKQLAYVSLLYCVVWAGINRREFFKNWKKNNTKQL